MQLDHLLNSMWRVCVLACAHEYRACAARLSNCCSVAFSPCYCVATHLNARFNATQPFYRFWFISSKKKKKKLSEQQTFPSYVWKPCGRLQQRTTYMWYNIQKDRFAKKNYEETSMVRLYRSPQRSRKKTFLECSYHRFDFQLNYGIVWFFVFVLFSTLTGQFKSKMPRRVNNPKSKLKMKTWRFIKRIAAACRHQMNRNGSQENNNWKEKRTYSSCHCCCISTEYWRAATNSQHQTEKTSDSFQFYY